MRRIIRGIAYDTEKAQLVHEWSNGCGHGDFHFCEESLYLTDAGRWFLHGLGGARSRYAERVDSSSWQGGQNIVPMTEDAAKAWLEEHAPAEVYERHFEAVDA